VTTATQRKPVRHLRHDPRQRPFIVIWEVTRACQLACVHCRADAIPLRDPLELTTDQGRRLLDEIASLGAPRPLMVLTGGDPFERPDLVELVAHGTAAGLSMALSPSVTPRFTRPTLTTMREAGAKAVSISLDGASATTHDAFRQTSGVFDATEKAMALVREVGLRLQINTTVTADNVHELPRILKQVLDAEASLWSVFFLIPTGRGSLLNPLTADQTEEVMHWLHEVSELVAIKTTEGPHYRRLAMQREHAAAAATESLANTVLDDTFPVGELREQLRADTARVLTGQEPRRRSSRPPIDVNSGKGFAFIDHVGTVYPSGFLPVPVGSVREREFLDIYRDAPLMRQLREPDAFGGKCGRCEFRTICGGSRSHAYAVTGDPLAEDPNCAYQPAGS
jgi:radical SAM protein